MLGKSILLNDAFYVGNVKVAYVNNAGNLILTESRLNAEQAGQFAGYIKKCQEVGLICGS